MTTNKYPDGLDELAIAAASSCDLFGAKQPPDVAAKQYARALLDALAERGYVLVDANSIQEPATWLHIPHEHLKDRVRHVASASKYNEPAVYAYILPCHPAIPGRVAEPEIDFFHDACRLALELECLLLDCRDTSVTAKWWDSAHEALEQHRETIRTMEASNGNA